MIRILAWVWGLGRILLLLAGLLGWLGDEEKAEEKELVAPVCWEVPVVRTSILNFDRMSTEPTTATDDLCVNCGTALPMCLYCKMHGYVACCPECKHPKSMEATNEPSVSSGTIGGQRGRTARA